MMKRIFRLTAVVSFFVMTIGVVAQTQETKEAAPGSPLPVQPADTILTVAVAPENILPANPESKAVEIPLPKSDIEILNDTIDNLRSRLGRQNQLLSDANEKIGEYQQKLILLASNGIYVPYDQYCIEYIYIPAFEGVKETPLYYENIKRLELLQNYKADTEEIIAFLKTHSRKEARTAVDMKKWMDTAKNDFMKLPSVVRYTAWDDGYLLKKAIKPVIATLSSPVISANGTVNSSQTLEKLEKELQPILSFLEQMLANGAF